jgi:hypothetical protein
MSGTVSLKNTSFEGGARLGFELHTTQIGTKKCPYAHFTVGLSGGYRWVSSRVIAFKNWRALDGAQFGRTRSEDGSKGTFGIVR